MLFTFKTAELAMEKEELFDLKRDRGYVKTTKKITLQPFESKHISGMSRVKGHMKKEIPLQKHQPNLIPRMHVQPHFLLQWIRVQAE